MRSAALRRVGGGWNAVGRTCASSISQAAGLSSFENALAVRQEPHIAQSKLSKRDWSVLRQVAVGYDYVKLASDNGVTPGDLRARVLRLRRRWLQRRPKP
jgi:hypothetical protein